MRPFVDDLYALSTRLLGAQVPEQVLELICREIQRLTGVDRLFASVAESPTWATGLHQCFGGAERADASAAQRSALFAAYRAVSRERQRVTLTRQTHATALDALCGDSSTALLALPLMDKRGRLSGCLALCLSSPIDDAALDVAEELASLAAIALENVRRIALAQRHRERLNLFAEAAEEALWDWSPTTGEFWWGGGVHSLIGDVVLQSRLSWKFDQVHPDDVERVRTSFERALAATDVEAWRDEYRQRRTDGTWIDVEDHAHILRDSSGRAHRVVGALRDVTELRALLAREHAARDEAERASVAKDEFLAMLGHELRNPLAPIVTALTLLERRASGPDRQLEVLRRQSHHLVRLVDDLLDVSRISRGKVDLSLQRTSLEPLIGRAIEMTTPLLNQRMHHLDVQVADGIMLDVDAARITQVFANLLANAAKYTDPGGRLRIEARAENGVAVICVADNGIGISAEFLPQIFEMFAQAERAIDRAKGGLGLGLSIVKNIVQLHGGTVAADSSGEGRGSEFIVRLPLATSRVAEVETPHVAPPNRRTTRQLLVVDDNEDAAEQLGELLLAQGHQVQVAYRPDEAIRLFSEMPPEVALIDIGLPVMDGYALARCLRSQPGGAATKLIAVTGYGQASDNRKATEAGFDAHLVKPVSPERLEQLIDDLTSS